MYWYETNEIDEKNRLTDTIPTKAREHRREKNEKHPQVIYDHKVFKPAT